MCQQQPSKYQMKNSMWQIQLHKDVLGNEYDKPKWEHSALNTKIKNAQKNYKGATDVTSKSFRYEAYVWGDTHLDSYLGYP